MIKKARSKQRPQSRQNALPTLLGGTLLVLAAAGLLLWLAPPGHLSATASTIGGPFRLIDGSGRPITDRSFAGRYELIYFGYTSCPDVCPTTLAAMADAMDRLGAGADRVQPLFITVDPQHDTQSVVHSFVSAFSPRLVGLTGSTQEIAAAERAFRIQSTIVTDPDGSIRADHSSVLFLLDPAGRFITAIRADLPGRAIAAEITRHMS